LFFRQVQYSSYFFGKHLLRLQLLQLAATSWKHKLNHLLNLHVTSVLAHWIQAQSLQMQAQQQKKQSVGQKKNQAPSGGDGAVIYGNYNTW